MKPFKFGDRVTVIAKDCNYLGAELVVIREDSTLEDGEFVMVRDEEDEGYQYKKDELKRGWKRKKK